MFRTIFFLSSFLLAFSGNAQKKTNLKIKDEPKPKYEAATLSGLKLRSIGPALTSGRIADIAVNPDKPHEYYLAVASGGVWKTVNAGTTFEPIFDNQGSYSIGCVALASSNSNVVWVGSGENNNQRSVAYGDGVYKSTDGGRNWKNMGLEKSEHIGMIAIHPENENIVYVAAYGPLWSAGGDRGIYKTTDGGITWKNVLQVSENTGFNEIHMDPRNPELLYATSHQRRRHVWTYIDGGPETAIYKTTDGGENWTKLETGLPNNDMGRIGIDISPVRPDIVYAIIAATEGGGFYRSKNRGESWEKMSDYQTSGNYYQEIICDPKDHDKIYSMDTWLHHTIDGGKTFVKTGEKSKHVDNHCIWIDPGESDHWLVGCDGGLYETWNAAGDWKYFPNLPITQFYKVAVDNDKPFYNIYGGTQDNFTQGGPSQTLTNHGIMNSDWYVTNGGDGFQPRVDPDNPDIVYGQSQYGGLIRFDRKSGEKVLIQPLPAEGDAALRWNWDAPLLISPHKAERLYFASNVLYKTEDRGNTWQKISGDLSRQIDRNDLKVMDKVWSVDAVAKNQSTSIYGNITALDESPVEQGLLYVGTDDGLIQVSGDDGKNWTEYGSFPGVPERTYVNKLIASQHDQNNVFAVFNNHKNGDFQPYLLKSTDRGVTWKNIASTLPRRGSVYSLAEDHIDANLLFCGTEFGLFFTDDGGANWNPLTSGLPTIAIRDLTIQQRENDLVLASFGRGFYILDDYSPLRKLDDDILNKPAYIFPVADALLYVQSSPNGLKGKAFMGESHFTAENPSFGAVFTYHVSDTLTTLKEKRTEIEKALIKEGKDVRYPDIESLRAEDREDKPYLLFVIKDTQGEIIRKIKKDAAKGIQRANWDLRYTSTAPIEIETKEESIWGDGDQGMLALPGKYSVLLYKSENGTLTQLHDAVSFNIIPLDFQSLPAKDKSEVLAFQENVAELNRGLDGLKKIYSENQEKLNFIKKAVETYPSAPIELMNDVKILEDLQYALKLKLYGDDTRSNREFETIPNLSDRIGYATYATWYNTSEITHTAKEQLTIALKLYPSVRLETQQISTEIHSLEKKLVELKVPYTPGRGADWYIE